jgi:hypothetical protein
LQTIDFRAFFGSAIQSIFIPSFVQTIRDSCFACCLILSRVAFQSGSQLREIEKLAFWGCGVESIEIPDMLSSINIGCFTICGRLRTCTFGPNCHVAQLEQSALSLCASLQSICIPASVTIICESCFAWCEQMRSLTFAPGSSLSVIEQTAFQGCTMLGPSVQLPASLTTLGGSCFDGCCTLSRIGFEPNSRLREIPSLTFLGCALKSFVIPASVLFIDWCCFWGSSQQTDITLELPSRVEKISSFDRGTTPEFSVPDSVRSMEVSIVSKGAFVCNFGRESKLEELVVSASTFGSKRVGFMRLSEPLLKRIRLNLERNEFTDARPSNKPAFGGWGF